MITESKEPEKRGRKGSDCYPLVRHWRGLLPVLFLAGCALFVPEPMGPGRCEDGEDNDNDGLIDLEDPQCLGDPNGHEEAACADLLDNDQDGWVDLDDPGCLSDPQQDTEVEACANGIDDDGDGKVDLEDFGCEGDSSGITESRPDLDCDDLQDNDEDGFIDLEDPQCTMKGQEAVECDDAKDNDGDELIDSLDPDCDDLHSDDMEASECGNGLDDDGDGLSDLDDPKCAGDPTWNNEEFGGCEDGADNDGDEWVDEKDPECYSDYATACSLSEPEDASYYDPLRQENGDPSLQECANQEDDDRDGFIDHEDPECQLKGNGCGYEEY